MYLQYQNKRKMHRRIVFTMLLCIWVGLMCCSFGEAGAQGDVVLPDLELNGQLSQNLGGYQLPQDFSFEAEVRVDASNQWRHLVEVGGVEYEWHCPLRIEVGNEGQWYIAVGDGGSYVDTDFQGSWQYGVWTKVLFTYVNGVGKFYENDVLIKEFVINKNVGAAPGSLIVGSFKGTERFFQGGIKNGRIVTGELTPGGGSGGGDASLIFQYAPNPTVPRSGFELQRNYSIGTLPPFDMRSHTVSFWVNPNQTESGWASILHFGNNNEQRHPALLFYPGSMRIHYRQATTANHNDGLDPGFQLQPNVWMHVAIVWEDQGGDSYVRVYYNGQVKAEGVKPHPVSASADVNVYASDPWHVSPGGAFLDDIRIYNRALSEQEVIDLLNTH